MRGRYGKPRKKTKKISKLVKIYRLQTTNVCKEPITSLGNKGSQKGADRRTVSLDAALVKFRGFTDLQVAMQLKSSERRSSDPLCSSSGGTL